jgi:hypothetical protein
MYTSTQKLASQEVDLSGLTQSVLPHQLPLELMSVFYYTS